MSTPLSEIFLSQKEYAFLKRLRDRAVTEDSGNAGIIQRLLIFELVTFCPDTDRDGRHVMAYSITEHGKLYIRWRRRKRLEKWENFAVVVLGSIVAALLLRLLPI